SNVSAQTRLDSIMPVRGFSIAAPKAETLDEFVKFIEEELAPRKVNTLLLRVDYRYRYQSQPELRDSATITRRQAKEIVKVCKKYNIKIVPHINLLGHQSGRDKVNTLLRVYPQFDETPEVKMADAFEKLRSTGQYLKGYCPLHPDLHKIIFNLIDEVCDVFEATSFHGGMDEVFNIGSDQCPRCSGRDRAELFANEVRTIREHLAKTGKDLWIWGDRLIDGKTSGVGRWEGSYNTTYKAVGLIPKDVVICDWHYERPDPTAVYFAMNGLKVITCPWQKPDVALIQVDDMVRLRKYATRQQKDFYQGMMHTVWSDPATFFNGFYGRTVNAAAGENTPWNTFRKMYEKIQTLDK
ncbi:family 20 glycosylhydrolase, partial [Daejeonella sp.]|uniref:family 20 glycosylhydrolase n=1 Tax=Daejeonella sp. TaxID=2805397 RepID=UPI0030BD3FA6